VTQVTWEIRYDLATFFLPLYCSLCLFAIWIVSHYKIDRESHQANLETLADRQKAANGKEASA